MDVRIDKPKLNRATVEENLAIVDKWIADTADKLNCFINAVNQKGSDDNGKRT